MGCAEIALHFQGTAVATPQLQNVLGRSCAAVSSHSRIERAEVTFASFLVPQQSSVPLYPPVMFGRISFQLLARGGPSHSSTGHGQNWPYAALT